MSSTPQDLKKAVWLRTKATTESVRQSGIDQFINIFNRQKNRQNDTLKFGDEVSFDSSKITQL